MGDSIKSLSSKNGFHQGDVLASWLFMMTMQPLLESINERINAEFAGINDFVNAWFIDDGNIHAPRPILLRIIEILQQDGPSYGYHLKLNKGSYLIGACASVAETMAVVERLTNAVGLNDGIVHPHPANCPEFVASYGVKLLGSYTCSN